MGLARYTHLFRNRLLLGFGPIIFLIQSSISESDYARGKTSESITCGIKEPISIAGLTKLNTLS